MTSPRKTAAAFAVVSTLAHDARGDAFELHGTAGLVTGYDTNVQAAPDATKQDAATIQLTPGFVVDYLAPQLRWELLYTHPFVFYIGAEDTNTSADNATLNLFYEPGPRTQVSLGLDFSRFDTGISVLGAAQDTVVAAQPAGDNTALTVGLSEVLRYEISEAVRWEQTAAATLFVPFRPEQPTSVTASFSTGPEARTRSHAFALLPGVSYTKPFVDSDEAEALGFLTEQQLVVTGRARWRWDWTRRWGSEVSGGASFLTDLMGGRTVAPVGTAAILYTDLGGYAATLRYRRAVTPNLVLGQTFFSDTVSASGRVPIVREHDVAAEGSIGFSWNRAIDQRANISTDLVNTFVGDLAVGWFPRAYPNITLRYQHIEQFNAPEGQILLPNYDRDTILLQVSFTYPPRTITVPDPRSRRVDESDRDFLSGPEDRRDRLSPRSSGPQ